MPCGQGAGPPLRSGGSGQGVTERLPCRKLQRQGFIVSSQSGHQEAHDWPLTRAWQGPGPGQPSGPPGLAGWEAAGGIVGWPWMDVLTVLQSSLPRGDRDGFQTGISE